MLKKYLDIKVIAMMGIFLSIQLIFSLIPLINLGFAQVSFDWIFYALYGLLFSWIGVIPAILGDNLSQLIRGTIGQWLWQYAIISIGIALVSALIKKTIFNNNENKIKQVTIISSIIAFVDAIFVLVLIINIRTNYYPKTNDYIYYLLPALLVFIGIQGAIIGVYLKTENDRFLLLVKVLLLLIILSVIFSWIWGPIAFIAWLNRFSSASYSLSGKYFFFLVPRIIKSPIEIIIWAAILAPVYEISSKYVWNNNNGW